LKIILFANTDWYLYNFRLPLAEKLVEEGHKVLLISPAGNYGYRILNAGYDWRQLSMSRKGINPLKEARSILKLIDLLKREKPNLIHNFTIKCMLYGTLAARLSGVEHIINAVTGLGYMFSKKNFFTLLATPLISALYRLLLKGTTVIFQNASDQQFLIKRNMVMEQDSFLVPSSGVDISRFIPKPEVVDPGMVILAAPMLWDKGVGEFVEAAMQLKPTYPSFRFVLVGSSDSGNPASISRKQLQEWVQEGIVEWWGWQEDMVSVYQKAEIVCLPSYHEGLSKSLIEAAACGRPLISTDIPGCREVVHHGINGLIVPKEDGKALAKAILQMLSKPKELESMGKDSRIIAENDYSLKKVVADTIQVYNQLIH